MVRNSDTYSCDIELVAAEIKAKVDEISEAVNSVARRVAVIVKQWKRLGGKLRILMPGWQC